MAITAKRVTGGGSGSEPILAQGIIERAFPDWLVACTKRVELDRSDKRRQSADGGFALVRGLVAGRVVEHELDEFTHGRGFTIAIDPLVDEFLAKERRATALAADRLVELRTDIIAMVRSWQGRFPPDDGGRDWLTAEGLLPPQMDFFVRRPGRFAIRVRPDLVVGIGDTIVCVEFTTAKDPSYLSPARHALNWHALARERLRRPDWCRFTEVLTRVELLALDEGLTVELTAEQAEQWRVAIGEVAEAVVADEYEANRGPHCSVCPWQAPCWFGEEPSEGDDF